MFPFYFGFEGYSISQCAKKIQSYLKGERLVHYKETKKPTRNGKRLRNITFNVPDTTFLVFGDFSSKNQNKIRYTLTYNKEEFKLLGLQTYEPDNEVKDICWSLYETYMPPTIRVVDDKVLFYLLLQYDALFVQSATSNEEYKALCERFGPNPTFNKNRFAQLQSMQSVD